MEYDNLLGDALYLLKDVARDDDGLALRAKLSDYAHDACPGYRVAAVQRLVEDDEIGIVNQCVGYLHALPHTLAVLAYLFVLDIRQTYEIEHVLGSRRSLLPCHPVQPREGGDEVKSGHPVVHPLRLADISDPSVRSGVGPRIDTEQPDTALVWLESAHQELEQSRFAGPVGTKHAGDATIYGQ